MTCLRCIFVLVQLSAAAQLLGGAFREPLSFLPAQTTITVGQSPTHLYCVAGK